MKYTIFDRLGCIPELAVGFERLGIETVFPRVILIGEEDSKTELLESLTGFEHPDDSGSYSTFLESPGLVAGVLESEAPVCWSEIRVVDVEFDLDQIKKYIEPTSSVIVVVIDAGEDLPDDILNLVAQIDPKYERTLGVLSCIDSVGIKMVANHLLCNDLKLGFKLVGYSGQDQFVEDHSFYSHLPFGYAGTDAVIEHVGQLASRVFCNHLQQKS
jgi:hypothetical protein